MSSTSENNNDTDTNKQDANYNKLDQFVTMGVDLWQTSAMSWLATYNEFVKNASKMSEYWLNLFSPWSKVKGRG